MYHLWLLRVGKTQLLINVLLQFSYSFSQVSTHLYSVIKFQVNQVCRFNICHCLWCCPDQWLVAQEADSQTRPPVPCTASHTWRSALPAFLQISYWSPIRNSSWQIPNQILNAYCYIVLKRRFCIWTKSQTYFNEALFKI